MNLFNSIISCICILATGSLIAIIILGYTITFSWINSIKLLCNSICFMLSKKLAAKIYQHQEVMLLKYDLGLIINGSDKDIQQLFNNNPIQIKNAAKNYININDEKLFSINLAKYELPYLHIYSIFAAYNFLGDQYAKRIMRTYTKKQDRLLELFKYKKELDALRKLLMKNN